MKDKFLFKTVSSDEIQTKLSADILEQDPSLTKDQAYDQARLLRNKAYEDEIKSLIEYANQNETGRIMVIFLDKLHPADKKGLGKATRFID